MKRFKCHNKAYSNLCSSNDYQILRGCLCNFHDIKNILPEDNFLSYYLTLKDYEWVFLKRRDVHNAFFSSFSFIISNNKLSVYVLKITSVHNSLHIHRCLLSDTLKSSLKFYSEFFLDRKNS